MSHLPDLIEDFLDAIADDTSLDDVARALADTVRSVQMTAAPGKPHYRRFEVETVEGDRYTVLVTPVEQ